MRVLSASLSAFCLLSLSLPRRLSVCFFLSVYRFYVTPQLLLATYTPELASLIPCLYPHCCERFLPSLLYWLLVSCLFVVSSLLLSRNWLPCSNHFMHSRLHPERARESNQREPSATNITLLLYMCSLLSEAKNSGSRSRPGRSEERHLNKEQHRY